MNISIAWTMAVIFVLGIIVGITASYDDAQKEAAACSSTTK